jgi:hypothetical protein
MQVRPLASQSSRQMSPSIGRKAWYVQPPRSGPGLVTPVRDEKLMERLAHMYEEDPSLYVAVKVSLLVFKFRCCEMALWLNVVRADRARHREHIHEKPIIVS